MPAALQGLLAAAAHVRAAAVVALLDVPAFAEGISQAPPPHQRPSIPAEAFDCGIVRGQFVQT